MYSSTDAAHDAAERDWQEMTADERTDAERAADDAYAAALYEQAERVYATAIAAEERRTAARLDRNPHADPTCKFCRGTGVVYDTVDYGSTTAQMPSTCECVEDVEDADSANWEPVIDYEPRRAGW